MPTADMMTVYELLWIATRHQGLADETLEKVSSFVFGGSVISHVARVVTTGGLCPCKVDAVI